MNKTLLKTKQCPEYGRLPKAKLKRNRPLNTVPVTLPIHTLEKFHRYTLNPMVMAVRDADINQHDLVKVDGEILKVVRVEEIAPHEVDKLQWILYAAYTSVDSEEARSEINALHIKLTGSAGRRVVRPEGEE